EHWFLGVEDAREKIGLWREDYNGARPHTSLGGATPAEFAKAAALRSPTAPSARRPGPTAPGLS
ncbi:MAG: transposase, partial [Candidatus Methylomirabilis sp.]|nr:transposase [Deltaproteobacteria bacterium]